MMCAFMTPVLKNDWEVYDTKKQTRRNKSSPKLTSVASAPEMSRAQQLQRLRQIQEAQRRLLEGDGQRSRSGSSRGGTKSCGVSASSSRTHLPISPLALENKSSNKGSNSSLNKFHNKVIDKLKDVLHIKDNKEYSELDQQQDQLSPSLEKKEPARTRESRSRLSSRSSFDIPKIITEEVVDANGALVSGDS